MMTSSKDDDDNLSPPEIVNEESPLLFDASSTTTAKSATAGGASLSSLPSSPFRPAFEGESWWSQLVFKWLDPILELGHVQDQLNPEDLDISPLAPEDSTSNVIRTFNKAWEKECQRVAAINEKKKKSANKNTTKKAEDVDEIRHPSLTRALFMAFGGDFMKAGGLKVINDCLQFVGPQVLNGMVQYVRDPEAPIWEGLGLTVIVTLAQIGMSLCLRHYFFRLYRVGLRVRTAIVMSVYEKSLVLDSRQDKTVGQITNLMSVDAARIQGITVFLHAIWYSFLQIGLALYFLWGQLGPSCLAGVAVIVLSIPLTAVVAGWMGRLQKKLMKAKDERIEINSEVISNMKVVKLQAWEEPFQNRIESLRAAELKRLLYYLLGRACSFLLWSAVPLLIALATFAAYVFSGNQLEVASALTALALFDIIRFPLFMLPNVINGIVEAGVAVDRVSSFLVSPEHKNPSQGNLVNQIGVEMDNATFLYDGKRPKDEEGDGKELSDLKWELRLIKSQLADAEERLSRKEVGTNKIQHERKVEEGSSSGIGGGDLNLLALRRVNFTLKEGEFVAIVGSVGAGKSTFLKSILGEVRRLTGDLSVNGKLGYFGQNAFIMNDTVKGNILFGSQEKRHLYNTAIDACALKHDLEMLPAGDMTEIGEKGITMSGGQKARIALARVLYHNADINLLDDPLAAVDAHVGRHLFEKAIVGEMLQGTSSGSTSKKKTVVLVTNALQYLSNPLVDRIVVLKDGRVEEQGSYAELTAEGKGGAFQSFLDSFNDSMEESTRTRQHMSSSERTDIEPVTASPPKFKLPPPLPPGQRSTRSQSVVLPNLKRPGVLKLVGRAKSLGNVKAPRGSVEAGDLEETIALMTDEMQEREKGTVDKKIYMSWARAAGGIWVLFVILLAYALGEGTSVLAKWWLTYWSQHGSINQLRFLEIYAVINVAAIITAFLRTIIVMLFALRASRSLFSRLLDRVLMAPMSFFDTTPVGRIINRFSKDVYSLDEELPGAFQMFVSTSFSVISTLAVVTAVSPFFAVCLIPIIYLYRQQQVFFTATYRELKRLDSVSRSPIYALFSETLDGVTTIRAFAAQIPLMNRMISMLDKQQHAYFLTTTAQCWLGVRLELIGTCIITFACLTAVVSHDVKAGDEKYAGLTGLAISYALSVTQALNWTVRMASDFEANMVSVERIEQYGKLKTEAPHKLPSDEKLDKNWPQHGKIQFKGVKLRYRPGLPLVLKGLDLTIPQNSKVGIVGRTGAGKSTLMTALLRLVELDDGKLLIDEVDTSTLGLAKLRSKLAVIPQDPVLFTGTVKHNLDPFDEFSDDRLCQVLARVGLMSSSQQDRDATDSCSIKSLLDPVVDGGANFSVGEKQLLVIARALLCGAAVVICDEATAAVDAETDARIQRVLRFDFEKATVLTVAHRLNTIMDSDYVLAMDDGRAVEFDSPSNLLAEEDGLFKKLVDTWEEEHGK